MMHLRRAIHDRPKRALAIILVLIALQLVWFGFSFTRRGDWISMMSMDVPRGNYFGMSRGRYYWMRLGPGWPTGSGPPGSVVTQWSVAGVHVNHFPTYVTVLLISIAWTLAPTVLCTAFPAYRLWVIRRERQRLTAGRCVSCAYDLRSSTERCPECGQPISDDARAHLHRREAELIPPPT